MHVCPEDRSGIDTVIIKPRDTKTHCPYLGLQETLSNMHHIGVRMML